MPPVKVNPDVSAGDAGANPGRMATCRTEEGERRCAVTVDAIFQGGVFKPLGEVKLAENQKVRLNIEPWDRQDALARFEEARRFREELRAKYGEFPDSTPDIAEDRMRDI
jgi:predicted DNA-binding antitoxin AbrB/MazE fold protein